MSRNFDTDIETQREYYNCQYFNNSGSDQNARYSVQLLKPFFMNPNKWQLAINRASVPLSMPLTHNNIPFNTWQIGIQYYSGSSGNTSTDLEYVQQFNQQTINTNLNQLISIDHNVNSYTIKDNTTNYTLLGTNFINDLQPGSINGSTYDYALISTNNQFLYAVSPNLTTFNIFNSQTGAVFYSYNAVSPLTFTACCANRATGDAYLIQSNATVIKFTRSNQTWTNSGVVFNLPYVAQVAVGINAMVCIAGNVYIMTTAQTGAPVGTDLTVYEYTTNTTPTNTYNLPIVGQAYGTYPNMITDGTSIYIQYVGSTNAQLIKYNTSLAIVASVNAIPLIQYAGVDLANGQFLLGFDANGNLLYGYAIEAGANGILKLNSSTLAVIGTGQADPTPSTNSSFLLYPQLANNQPVESGPYDIYNLQDYLNKINSALATSFNNLKNSLGSTFLPTEPPLIVFQPSTKLFQLVCEGLYTTLNSDGSNQYSIIMNEALYSKFNFPSSDLIIEGTPYESITLVNYGFNAIQGNGSSSLPQYISVTQNQSTIYAFNDLTRIIFATNEIPVSGDGDGVIYSNQGATSNKTLSMITDIAPDTTEQMVGTRLIYVPAGVLRWYNLYATQPFTKIDMQVYYEMKDGQIYSLIIPNAEYFSVKLEFKKGPGDA